MKKVFCNIIAVIILLSFVGCSVSEQGSKKEYTTHGKVTQLVPDEKLGGSLTVGWFMPQGTSKTGGDFGDQINAASKIFKKLYPNVELIIDRNPTEDFSAYSDKLMTELMAGKGADLLWLSGKDVNKLMRSGALADMFDYFENDEFFNVNDYNVGVLCGGQPKGKQYIVPAFYRFPLMLTTQNVAQKAGLDVLKFTDYISSYEQIEAVAQKYNGDVNTKTFFTRPAVAVSVPMYTGVEWIDYDSGKINLDFPEIKMGFDVIKSSFSKDYISPDYSGFGTASPATAFKEGKAIFHEMTADPFLGAMTKIREIEKNGDKPILFGWRNSSGKISATPDIELGVNSSSENKQAAYNFIKILINPAVQTNSDYYSRNVPISNESVKIWLERQKDIALITDANGKTTELSPLSQEIIDQYTVLLKDIENDYLWYGLDYFREAMLPYIKGEKSYEECIEVLQTSLEIYVSE